MAKDGPEQRAHPRFPFDVEIRISSPAAAGRTTNLSFGGVALMLEGTPPELRLGERLKFTLMLDDGPLELMGNLCWRSGKLLGLSFDGLVRDQRLEVSALVDKVRASTDSDDA